MTAISKNVYIEKIDNIVNKHNNSYHQTNKIKPIDLKSSTCFDFDVKNDNDPKFKFGDYARTLKCKKKHFKEILHAKLVRRIFCY